MRAIVSPSISNLLVSALLSSVMRVPTICLSGSVTEASTALIKATCALWSLSPDHEELRRGCRQQKDDETRDKKEGDKRKREGKE